MKKIYYCLSLVFLMTGFRPAFAQIDTVSNLSSADKLYGLSKFWSEAKYNFAYFDHAKINWDSTYQAYIPKILATKSTWEYYMLMQRFCALLKDGHTDIDFPQALMPPHASRYRWINIENFNKKLIVTDIPLQFKDQVPLGSELVSVNGMDAKAYAEKEIIPYISSSTEHVLWNTAAAMMFYGTDTAKVWHLKLRSPKGKLFDYNYQYHTYRANWVRRGTNNTPWKVLNYENIDGIAYVKLNSFGDESIVTEFKKIVPELYKCKGVILDLRGNGGGNSGVGAEILMYFTDQKVLVGSAWKTRDNLSAYRAWGTYELMDTTKKGKLSNWQQKSIASAKGEYWYKGDTMTFYNYFKEQKIKTPLVVLCGNNTASAAEDFLVMIDGLKGRATTIGQRTYGSTGQPLPLTLPGFTARICTKRDTYPDGRDFVGVGVIPDIEVSRTPEDVINGTDAVLKRALKEINNKK
ncbi:Peptidase family S41 [Mucilaginibacter sp. OK268]|uniref:S41 family peptidase n=1 Tax=Mucilaginibacter sp. OK268 TaxID=1881048 RepID=UPI0008839125|nr:S41 family peptidase [Mucilaginibacter sp. OK268]SDP96483.1 Peptidase family S41 [Mucilaginibacter sp. OK268]